MWKGIGASPSYLREPLPVHMIHHDDLIVEGPCCTSWAKGEGGNGQLVTWDLKPSPREGG